MTLEIEMYYKTYIIVLSPLMCSSMQLSGNHLSCVLQLACWHWINTAAPLPTTCFCLTLLPYPLAPCAHLTFYLSCFFYTPVNNYWFERSNSGGRPVTVALLAPLFHYIFVVCWFFFFFLMEYYRLYTTTIVVAFI